MRNIIFISFFYLASCSFLDKDHPNLKKSEENQESVSSSQRGKEVEAKSAAPTRAATQDPWKFSIEREEPFRVFAYKLSDEKRREFGQNFMFLEPRVYYDNRYPSFRFLQFDGRFVWNKLFVAPVLVSGSEIESIGVHVFRSGVSAEGDPLVTLSVPFALVDGMSSGVFNPGTRLNSRESVYTLPAHLRDLDLEALKTRFQKEEILTLPSCPKRMALLFEGLEYHAQQIFEGQGCRYNEFFYVDFQLPFDLMKRIVDASATNPQSVQVVSYNQTSFQIPNEIKSLKLTPEWLSENLSEILNASRQERISLAQLQNRVTKNLYRKIKQIGYYPSWELIAKFFHSIRTAFFNDPEVCAHGLCTQTRDFYRAENQYSMDVVDLFRFSNFYESTDRVSLGAITHQSDFVVRPALSVWLDTEKPTRLRSLSQEELLQECANVLGSRTQTWEAQYCANLRSAAVDQINNDYTPLGTNLTVFPGAWLRLEIDQIEEFTRASQVTEEDGTEVIQPEVRDLLSLQGVDPIECVESDDVACLEYETEMIPIRDLHGEHIRVQNQSTIQQVQPGLSEDSIVDQNGLMYRKRLKFDCDEGDKVQTCPWNYYDVTHRDNIRHECKEVTEENSVLIIFSRTKNTRIVCEEVERTPVEFRVLRSMCPQYLPYHEECRNPRYRCKRYNSNCKRFIEKKHINIVHQKEVPWWRKLALQRGEQPKVLEEGIWLRFTSPAGVSSECQLSRFGRRLNGTNVILIKIPSPGTPENNVCGLSGNEPLWKAGMTQADALPKVWIKNLIQYPERRFCGTTEVLVMPKSSELPRVPGTQRNDVLHIRRPLEGSCHAENKMLVDRQFMFDEYPPIQLRGKVSVIGRMLESFVGG